MINSQYIKIYWSNLWTGSLTESINLTENDYEGMKLDLKIRIEKILMICAQSGDFLLISNKRLIFDNPMCFRSTVKI